MADEGVGSAAHLVGDIIGNIQEIVRAEVRLASLELREGAAKLKQVALLLGVAAVMAGLGLVWLLYAVIHVLALAMPLWGAALIVSLTTLGAAGAVAWSGRNRMRLLRQPLSKTKASLQEITQWK